MPTTENVKRFVTAECKQFDDEEMSFVAYASKETIDRDDEVIKAGGWDLGDFTKSPVMQVDHDLSVKNTAGKAQWTKIERDGLKFKPVFAKTPLGRDMYELYKMGALTSFSVGFQPIAWEDHDKGDIKRTFTKQKLIEISCVTTPSNVDAVVQRLNSGDVKTKSLAAVLQKSVDDILHKDDKEKATFDIVAEKDIDTEIKATDLAGNPSIHDVMRAIQSELSRTPEGEQYVWVMDIFPVNNAAGNVIVEFSSAEVGVSEMRSQLWQYSYTYNPETETATVFDPVAVESTFDRKDFAGLQGKAGRVLSARTMSLLSKARDSMGTAAGDIDGLLSEQDKPEKESESEETKEAEIVEPEKETIDIGAIIKEQFEIATDSIEKKTISKDDVSDIVSKEIRRSLGRLT